jgi:hypothetical protein
METQKWRHHARRPLTIIGTSSQCGLLQHHARLASSCWSGSTGRESHPQGSDEGFQSCKLHLIPPSQALLGAIDATCAPKCILDGAPSMVGRARFGQARYVHGWFRPA